MLSVLFHCRFFSLRAWSLLASLMEVEAMEEMRDETVVDTVMVGDVVMEEAEATAAEMEVVVMVEVRADEFPLLSKLSTLSPLDLSTCHKVIRVGPICVQLICFNIWLFRRTRRRCRHRSGRWRNPARDPVQVDR